MRLIPLQSSNVAGIAYNQDEKELIVQFTNGTFYRYRPVPGDVVLSVLFDPDSQGKAFNAKIKDAIYPYVKIENPELLNLHV